MTSLTFKTIPAKSFQVIFGMMQIDLMILKRTLEYKKENNNCKRTNKKIAKKLKQDAGATN